MHAIIFAFTLTKKNLVKQITNNKYIVNIVLFKVHMKIENQKLKNKLMTTILY